MPGIRRSLVLAVVAAAAAASLAAAAPASATIIYKARLSGTYAQHWNVHDPASECVSGGGTQVTRFATRGRVKVGGSTDTEGYDPRANSINMIFAPFAVHGTITRTDTTATVVSDACEGAQAVGPHDCGPARRFTIPDAVLRKGRGLHHAKLHLDLTGFDDTYTRRGVASRLFKGAKSCYAPDADEQEGSAGFRVPWPTNNRLGHLHRTFAFSGAEPFVSDRDHPTYLPNGMELSLDSGATLHWKVKLTSACFRDPTKKGLRCSRA
jgi:hypothetical protein